MSKKMEKRQLSWYEHVMRMEHNALIKKIIDVGTTGKRRRGNLRG